MDWIKKKNAAEFDFESGEILLIDKPAGWTSFDVVNKVRHLIKRYAGKKIKVGHSGTLDPLATGLLVLATGKKTKMLESLTGLDKEYTGTITLGSATPSYDLETEPGPVKETAHISEKMILEAASELTGEIMQIPPSYSAIRKEGKRLYKSARAGLEVKADPRKVRVDRFDIEEISMPLVKFKVACGKGTYIRSLAHDMGQILGCGGHLSSLRRTAIDAFRVEDAFRIDELMEILNKEKREGTPEAP